MKITSRKSVAVIAVPLLFVSGLTAVFIVFWNRSNGAIPETDVLSPRYLAFRGTPSKIYLISATSSYGFSDETYASADGSEFPKGSHLFVISLTLRNDYTKDVPPPSMGNPVSPVDGTAYVCLTFTLRSKDGIIRAVNVTPADFRSPSPDETGIVLASGQTNHSDVYLATNRTDVSQFEINLTFVGDSIPR